MILIDDQIGESSRVGGSQSADLDGALPDRIRFRDVYSPGQLVGYSIFADNGQFERGLGRLDGFDRIIRSVPLVSSNANALVDFEPGTKRIVGSTETGAARFTMALGHFRSFLSANQTVTAGVVTQVEHDSETHDLESWFDPVTFRYTPKLPGLYWLQGQVGIAAGEESQSFASYVRKNGLIVARKVASASNAGQQHVAAATKVALDGISDYVDHAGAINGTGSKAYDAGDLDTFFEGWRVGLLP